MKFLLMSLLVGLVGSVTLAHTPVTPWRDGVTSPRLEVLEQQVRSGDSAAIERFWAQVQRQHTPLIEAVPGDRNHLLVTFLYRAQRPVTSVALVSQLRATRDSGPAALARLAGTDIWYKTYLLPNDMRLSYSFVPDPTPQSLAYHSELQLRDPLNPLVLPQGVNEGLSMLQLPGAAPQPWIVVQRDVPAGRIEEMHVESKILHAERRAWIYLPPGYDAGRTASYPVLACFDGYVYSSSDWVPTPTILDNLIHARKIPPTIGVFIDQSPQPARNLELSNNPQFADFVATELMPAIRQKWRATSDARQTTACGSSAGGLASLYIAFRHPEVFGNVLSQSAALWPGKTRDDPEHEWLTRQFEASPKLPLRFVIQAGDLEVGATPLNGPSILAANRHLRDVLLKKGYLVHYSEVAGGHEPITWRGGIAQGLMQLESTPASPSAAWPKAGPGLPFQWKRTTWTYTEAGTRNRLSIDARGNYIEQTMGGRHIDRGTATMKAHRLCFTSAQSTEAASCWTVKPLNIGQTMVSVGDTGQKMEITRIEYLPLKDPS